MSQIVAQMVARGFLGDDDLCRNPAFLNLMYDFLEDSFIAAHHLRRWPIPMRNFASRFMPSCRKVRAELQEVVKYLEPMLEKEDGPDTEMTALGWVKEASKGSAYDFTTLQLTLALASLDTSNDLLVKTLCDLSDNPSLVDDIRTEIIEVVGEEGLTKSSLQRLYLLDSAMKESQRIRPLGYSNMERVAKERVVLPDGLIIPKGTAIMVSACHMMDSSVWPDGDKYDGYRFANLRKNAKNSLTSPFQLTSTSANHMGFGHGKQACPGRHYAAVFGKILLCHVILKYDFKVILPEAGRIQLRGHNILPHADIKINIRRRRAEICL
ncbi:cytochrome P450 [Penicillium sp. IBT 35674x]|nr:cytochrome P450 [Penicillium sp. IBT 35674x]